MSTYIFVEKQEIFLFLKDVSNLEFLLIYVESTLLPQPLDRSASNS